MSKEKVSTRRQLLILGKVRAARKPIPRDELMDYINSKLEYDEEHTISTKTPERDIRAIEDLFKITISYNRTKQGYYIADDMRQYDDRINELLINFDLLNSISRDSNLSTYVLAEHHRPAYSEWLAPLVNAIKRTRHVAFDYVNYRRNNATTRVKVRPHYLKESDRRWYLLAYEGDTMKTYGVDRIRNLGILDGKPFTRNTDIDVAQLFKDCYGIWNDESIPVEETELRYDALDGNPAECSSGEKKYKYHWNTTVTGITAATAATVAPPRASAEATYGTDGARSNVRQGGISIIRHSDGTARKVLSK